MTAKRLIAAALTSTGLLTATLAIGLVLEPAAAWAEKGGNGNGRGNSDRGNSERGNGNGRGNAERGNNGRGAIASELKNLNAFCANENAFANAADDSNIGQIRAYQQASAEVETYDASVRAALGLSETDPITDAQIDGAIAYYEAEIARLEAELAAIANGTLTDDGADRAGQIALLEASIDTFEAYDDAATRKEETLLVATRGRTLSAEAQAYLDAGCPRG